MTLTSTRTAATSTAASAPAAAATAAGGFALPAGAPPAARVVLGLLQRLQHGTLDLQLPDGTQLHLGQAPSAASPTAHAQARTQAHTQAHTQNHHRAAMRLHNWQVCSAVLKSGDIGFAESWIAGHWSSPDLVALLTLFIANRDTISQAIHGSWWGRLVYRVRHLLNRNSRRGSKKNIHAHYDIGNAFYRQWLDETMNYSSAWFGDDRSQPMAQAQGAKVRRALQECGVQPGQRLLEIGCGWGALAEVAARDFEAHVTGVTLSSEQLVHAQERLAKAGLAQRADLRLQDYRDISDEPFDAIASIEMFEAVGREYWDSYFQTVRNKLKPGGRACIQSITIHDDLFENYLRSTDFIQQYIFPGGLLPSRTEFARQAAKAGLEVVNELAFGADYAETLRRWRVQFLKNDGPLRQLGYDQRFMRIWEFYLAYCEAAFATGNTDVVQFTLRRPA